MKTLLAALLCTMLTVPAWAQLSKQQLPITRRLPDNSLTTETKTVGAALDGLLQESAVKSYHAELQALKTALGADAKTVRARLKPIQDRLQKDRPRVQLGSFVRGLDSLLKTTPAAATAATAGSETGVKPIPDAPSDEKAGADTSALSAPVTEETGAKAAGTGDGYWPWVVGLALLAALALGALYVLARQEISRLKRRESFGSNEQLMAALRKQVQTQHDEIRQLQDENDALRRRLAAPPVPVETEPVAEPPVLQPIPVTALEPEPSPSEATEPEPAAEPEPVEVTFFLSTPNRDGSFLDVRRLEFIPSQSLYQFRLTNAEGTEAEFVFADDPASVRQALSSPETYLQPVCEYTDLRLDAQRIRTTRFGKARQSEPGERWELVEKALVTFG
jgi:hypothetical protein